MLGAQSSIHGHWGLFGRSPGSHETPEQALRLELKERNHGEIPGAALLVSATTTASEAPFSSALALPGAP